MFIKFHISIPDIRTIRADILQWEMFLCPQKRCLQKIRQKIPLKLKWQREKILCETETECKTWSSFENILEGANTSTVLETRPLSTAASKQAAEEMPSYPASTTTSDLTVSNQTVSQARFIVAHAPSANIDVTFANVCPNPHSHSYSNPSSHGF